MIKLFSLKVLKKLNKSEWIHWNWNFSIKLCCSLFIMWQIFRIEWICPWALSISVVDCRLKLYVIFWYLSRYLWTEMLESSIESKSTSWSKKNWTQEVIFLTVTDFTCCSSLDTKPHVTQYIKSRIFRVFSFVWGFTDILALWLFASFKVKKSFLFIVYTALFSSLLAVVLQ